MEHAIDTQNATPVKQYARKIPHIMKEKVKKPITEMLERKIIQSTRSLWAREMERQGSV